MQLEVSREGNKFEVRITKIEANFYKSLWINNYMKEFLMSGWVINNDINWIQLFLSFVVLKK